MSPNLYKELKVYIYLWKLLRPAGHHASYSQSLGSVNRWHFAFRHNCLTAFSNNHSVFLKELCWRIQIVNSNMTIGYYSWKEQCKCSSSKFLLTSLISTAATQNSRGQLSQVPETGPQTSGVLYSRQSRNCNHFKVVQDSLMIFSTSYIPSSHFPKPTWGTLSSLLTSTSVPTR